MRFILRFIFVCLLPYRYPIFPSSFVEKDILPPLSCAVLYSVSMFYICIPSPVWNCMIIIALYSKSLNRTVWIFHFYFFFQDCFGYSDSLNFLYKFQNQLVYIYNLTQELRSFLLPSAVFLIPTLVILRLQFGDSSFNYWLSLGDAISCTERYIIFLSKYLNVYHLKVLAENRKCLRVALYF